MGAGIFGCTIAEKLAEVGLHVDLYERNGRIMGGASRKTRLHLGYHYPRDETTASQCRESFGRFVSEFPDCVEFSFPSTYFIASEGSQTSPEEYLSFCHRTGLDYRPLGDFPVEVRNTSLGILTDEAVFDFEILTEVLERRIGKLPNLAVKTSREFEPASGAYDVVVNATYANLNALSAELGYPVEEAHHFEYTAMPIVRLRGFPKVGVTVLDGPFMNVLPLGKTEKFLLYHVDHTVIERTNGEFLPRAWMDPESAPFSQVDKRVLFERIVDASKHFVPAVNGAELLGFIEGPRMVLPRREADDARPSIVRAYGPSYITVFSSKVSHCVGVADEVCDMVMAGVPGK